MPKQLKRPETHYYSRAESVSLKEHIEARLEAMEKAVDVAKDTMNLRLEGMNEFRAQLSAQANTFLPRSEYQVQYDALSDKINGLDKRVQGVELLKADVQGRIWATAVVVTLAIAGIQVIIHFVMGGK